MSVTAAIEANGQAIGEQPSVARVIFKVEGELVGPTEVDLRAETARRLRQGREPGRVRARIAYARTDMPNDVMLLPPGHDAWSVGDDAAVFVEFSRGNDYYDEPAP